MDCNRASLPKFGTGSGLMSLSAHTFCVPFAGKFTCWVEAGIAKSARKMETTRRLMHTPSGREACECTPIRIQFIKFFLRKSTHRNGMILEPDELLVCSPK